MIIELTTQTKALANSFKITNKTLRELPSMLFQYRLKMNLQSESVENLYKAVVLSGLVAIPSLINAPSHAGVSQQSLADDRNYALLTNGALLAACEGNTKVTLGKKNGTEFVVKLATGKSTNQSHTGLTFTGNKVVSKNSPHNGWETLAIRLLGCKDKETYNVALRTIRPGIKERFIRAGCGSNGNLCLSRSLIPDNWETFEMKVVKNSANKYYIRFKDYRGNNVFVAQNKDIVSKPNARTITSFRVLPSPWQHNFDRNWGRVRKVSGTKPLITVLMDWPNRRKAFHDQCAGFEGSNIYSQNYVRDMLFRSPSNVNSWFKANSYNKFSFVNHAVIDWSLADRDFASGNITTGMSQKLRDLDRTINFAQFDRNGDRKVDDQELTIIFFLAHDKCYVNRGGFARYLDGFRTNDGVVLGNSVGQKTLSSAHIYAHAPWPVWNHELTHTGFRVSDMYAEEDARDTGGKFSNLSNSWSSVHLDAVHKIKLGWMPPRAAYNNGKYTLKASNSYPDALVVYNPQNGANEYFVLEFRPRQGFDAGITTPPASQRSSTTRGCAGGDNRTVENGVGKTQCEFLARGLPSNEGGLVIWRMNEQAGNDPRRAIQLMAASGEYNQPGGTRIPTPHAINISSQPITINDNSSPLSLKWSNNQKTGIEIRNIRANGHNIDFELSVNPVP